MTDSTLIQNADHGVTLSAARHVVALDACWEIERLAQHLAVNVIPDDDPLHLVVRGIAGRIRSLSRVVMSGLHDELEPVAHLEREVFGTAQTPAA